MYVNVKYSDKNAEYKRKLYDKLMFLKLCNVSYEKLRVILQYIYII